VIGRLIEGRAGNDGDTGLATSPTMRELIRFATHRSQQLVDITEAVQAMVERSGITEGVVHVYAQGRDDPGELG
jgi:hypothetical protein